MDDARSRSSILLARRAIAGDSAGWQALLGRVDGRLRRMVAARLDPRLRGRFDPSDVLQDAYLEASTRLEEYVREPRLPFLLWMRRLAGHYLGRIHRDHLGRRCRDVGREVRLDRMATPDASSAALADLLVGREGRPSELADRAERRARVREVLDRMDRLDREVLTLRHFEQLSRSEAAEVLGISEAAVAKRYLRALERVRDVMSGLPGGLDGFR